MPSEVRSFSLDWYEANRLKTPTSYATMRKIDPLEGVRKVTKVIAAAFHKHGLTIRRL
jgi:hypothetical protein